MWEQVSRKLLPNVPRNEVKEGGLSPSCPPGTSQLPGLQMMFSDSTDHSFPTYPGQNHRQSKHIGGAGLDRGFTLLKDASAPLGDIQNSSLPPTPAVHFPGLEDKIQENQREAMPKRRHPDFTGHPPEPRRAWEPLVGKALEEFSM